jgi:hypothetical protein
MRQSGSFALPKLVAVSRCALQQGNTNQWLAKIRKPTHNHPQYCQGQTMPNQAVKICHKQEWMTLNRRVLPTACLLFALAALPARAQGNLLQNPGFEETPGSDGAPPGWVRTGAGVARITVTDKEAQEGRQCVAIPAESAIEQRIEHAEAGAYLLRCWVKSESDQPVTLLLEDPERPWEAYSCTELPTAKNQWTQLQAFCVLDKKGVLKVTLGGMSEEFRLYHGVSGIMASPILMDGCELIRQAPADSAAVAVWDAKKELSAMPDWSSKGEWAVVENNLFEFAGAPLFQARHLAGMVRRADGGLVICAIQGQALQARTVLVPSPPFAGAKCDLIQAGDRTGIRVTSQEGEHSYTAWLTAKGLVRIEASQVPAFQAQGCAVRYGLLPSLAGSDICYDPQKLLDTKRIRLPSTQWWVGLVDGNESLMVVAWETNAQAVSLGMAGEGENRMFDSFFIATDKAAFSISFVEHAGIWHQEPLQEDWLNEYVPIAWERPFPARWMGEFFVCTGGRPYFGEPYLQYSFPFANAKTRMWGVWFEDWNHYPFYFDGARTIFHFEKGFVPKGTALVYFLEPAAADLYSPCEILEQALGPEKAAALLDLDANGLRKLTYSTPAEFMYDRPVCATTTRLSRIPRSEKGTVGIHLATHLYEFIREIRGRLDQYVSFFDRMQDYLDGEDKAHPDIHPYIAELQAMVSQAKSKAAEIYATPLTAVQEKTEGMKKLLLAGEGDGFKCGNLDVRDTAGEQDDLCRHYNRLVLRLSQTAALKCGDSPEKALIAQHIWDQARMVLRQPVRWEARRTLYFFEP